jgi:hypothetical protein
MKMRIDIEYVPAEPDQNDLNVRPVPDSLFMSAVSPDTPLPSQLRHRSATTTITGNVPHA